MALWSRPDPAEVASTGSDEFEGRSAEEALLRAREALGPSVELRCWKTRRGGVAGFFATEVYVAGTHPPPGAEGSAPRGRRAARARAAAREASHDGPSDEGGSDHATGMQDPAVRISDEPDSDADAGSAPSEQVPDALAALIEDTTDQLTLQFDSISPSEFHDVLAEAEAALTAGDAEMNREKRPAEPAPRASDITPSESISAPPVVDPAPEVTTGDAESRPPTGAKADRTGAKAAKEEAASLPAVPKDDVAPTPPAGEAPTPPATGAPTKPSAPARRSSGPKSAGSSARKPAARPVPDLYDRLRGLGLPDAHMPRAATATLDALLQAMDGLPVAPPLPTKGGTVVVVIGTRRPLDRTTRLLLGESPYLHGPRKAPGQRAWTVEDPAPSCEPDEGTPSGDPTGGLLHTGDDLLTVQTVTRRRSAGRSSLVTVESDPGLPIRSTTLAFIESLQPDYVLGAVSASMKRQDVEQWRDHLPSMDALAVWGVDSTYSPAELLGAAPITFVDGERSSAMGWTLTLLGRAMETQG